MTWLFLAAYSKMQEERGKLKEEQLSKKELGLDEILGLEKMIKLGDLLLGKHALEKKVKGMAGQPFASASERSKDQCIHLHSGLFKENRLVTRGFPQPYQQNLGLEILLYRKDLGRGPSWLMA